MSSLRVTCVHQGFELYGSDRCFAESVAAMRSAFPDACITVVLPRSGPILDAFAGCDVRFAFEPLWVLRRRELARLATTGLAMLAPSVARAARRFAASDLVFINTSVVADYLLAAHRFPGRAILHIHEIPEGATRIVLRMLAQFSRARTIFNSRATRQAFDPAGLWNGAVIYNGIDGPPSPAPLTYDGNRPLRILLLGRINRVKGQEVLLEALARLPAALRDRVRVRMAGGAFENPAREAALAAAIEQAGLAAHVTLEPFAPDPTPLYQWADIVAVPSRLPESLGRVAIEAMAHGRPALASRIGGLAETVEPGVSGWLVPPGDAVALAHEIETILLAPDAWRCFPQAARARYEALFSAHAARQAIASFVAETVASARA